MPLSIPSSPMPSTRDCAPQRRPAPGNGASRSSSVPIPPRSILTSGKLLVRVDGDPGNVHLSAPEMDEKQHVVRRQSSQREDLHCEEVGPRRHFQVSPNECRPGDRVFALRRGRYTVTAQNIADCLIRYLMPQIGQRPDNPDRFSLAMRTINSSTLGRSAAGPGLDAPAIHRACERRAFATMPRWCLVERRSLPRRHPHADPERTLPPARRELTRPSERRDDSILDPADTRVGLAEDRDHRGVRCADRSSLRRLLS